MADIAFLLLIFFLVTTTIETDAGLHRKLPPKDTPPPPTVKERNVLRINLNKENQLLVNNEVLELTKLEATAIAFLDNRGCYVKTGEYCDYCEGEKDPNSSDNPQKAVIVLKTDLETKYNVYVAVQNEINAAYRSLRNREAQRLFDMDYTDMERQFEDPQTPLALKQQLLEKISRVKNRFPQKLSEANLLDKTL